MKELMKRFMVIHGKEYSSNDFNNFVGSFDTLKEALGYIETRKDHKDDFTIIDLDDHG